MISASESNANRKQDENQNVDPSTQPVDEHIADDRERSVMPSVSEEFPWIGDELDPHEDGRLRNEERSDGRTGNIEPIVQAADANLPKPIFPLSPSLGVLSRVPVRTPGLTSPTSPYKPNDAYSNQIEKELATSGRLKRLPQRFKCSICPKSFTQERMRDRHVAVHKKYKCTACPLGFVFKRELRAHTLQDHPPIAEPPKYLKYRCSECNLRFRLKRDLSAHALKEHISKTGYSCSQCHMIFVLKETLAVHVDLFHSRNSNQSTLFTCDGCSHVFREKEAHACSVEGHSRFPCSQCSEVFRDVNVFKAHEQDAHKDSTAQTEDETKCAEGERAELNTKKSRAFVCLECSESFISKYRFSKHLETVHGHVPIPKKRKSRTHSTNDVVVVSTAGSERARSLGSGPSLSRSSTSNSPLFRQVFLCHHCPLSLPDYDSFRSHLQLTHGTAPPSRPSVTSRALLCKFCRKGFNDERSFRTHMRIHLGEQNPFACTLCRWSFPSCLLLESHMSGAHSTMGVSPTVVVSVVKAKQVSNQTTDTPRLNV